MKDKIIYFVMGGLVLVGVLFVVLFNKKSSGDISLNNSSELKSMINSVYKMVDNDLPSLETSVIDVSDKDMVESFTGLSNNDSVEAVVVSEPLMTSQAYSFVAVKFKNGTNIDSVKEEMYNNINMDKWICVSADVLYLTNYDNTVVYVMSDEEWGKPVYEAFKKYVDNKNGKELIKNNSLSGGGFSPVA